MTEMYLGVYMCFSVCFVLAFILFRVIVTLILWCDHINFGKFSFIIYPSIYLSLYIFPYSLLVLFMGLKNTHDKSFDVVLQLSMLLSFFFS